MSLIGNKHVIAALIIAPILAVASYVLVDQLVKERPHSAIAGNAYSLVAQSNCRYSSGVCTVQNTGFKSTLRVHLLSTGRYQLALHSNTPLQTAVMGFVTADGHESTPIKLNADTDDRLAWSFEFNQLPAKDTRLRIALGAKDAHYFVETSTAFVQYQTAFDEDFRRPSH